MLENCDTLLNATAVYHQNHDCATRSALDVGVCIRMAPPTYDQLQTQEVRGSHRESVLLSHLVLMLLIWHYCNFTTPVRVLSRFLSHYPSI